MSKKEQTYMKREWEIWKHGKPYTHKVNIPNMVWEIYDEQGEKVGERGITFGEIHAGLLHINHPDNLQAGE
jgi:pseudouridine-5'-phosphate glycosidase